MQLARLLESVAVVRVEGSPERDITAVCHDSRMVVPGALFVALRGGRTDGHHHVGQAVERGAAAVLCEEAIPCGRATRIEVADTRAALPALAALFNGHPSRRLKVSAVTGTNGKTTVAFLMRHLCEAAHHRCGVIGTVRYEIGGRILPASHTTPEASELQDLLGQMVAAGCRAVSMEVSSHALAQQRAGAIDFDVCIFTNLTQDHLDFHGTMAAYFDAKCALFDPPAEGVRKPRKAVVNLDDPYGAKLIVRIGKTMPVVTYGLGVRADFRATGIQHTIQGTTFELKTGGRSFLVRLPLIGRFNVYNALAALAAAHALGFDLRASVRALAEAPQVPGRLQAVPGRRRYQVYIDYAHTPDALSNALRTLRDLAPAGLITLFGCGGNRDRGKRPLMARAAAEFSDFILLTSDNPRDEEPEAILAEVAAGFPAGTRHEVIVDRAAAIRRAVALAGPQDVVLIAGKGHETTQEIAGRKIPFDDAEMAARAIDERNAAEVNS